MFNVNRRNNQFLYDGDILALITGAYELIEIAELIKEETDGNVIIEPDKNTMKSIKEKIQGEKNFDIENSKAPLLGFRKIVYRKGKYTFPKIVDIVVLVLLKFILM